MTNTALRWHLTYAKELLRHKWLVFLEGRKLNVPLPQLILHDWSKFLPDEWLAAVRYLSTGEASHAALETHHRNRHHPQWWLVDKNGRREPQPMPDAFRREMLADWRAAGRAKGSDTRAWYLEHEHRHPLHPETRAWVEAQLRL